MKKLSDEELLDELKARINERKQAFRELEKLNAELHEANRRLMESEKLKSNFLSNARNEIINPLSSILSLSQAIAANDDNNGETRKMAGIVYKSAFDLDFQMNNIFSSAEIEAGEAVCEYSNVNLSELLEESIGKFTDLADRHSKTIIFEKPAGKKDNIIKTDPSKIRVIVNNLIVNAILWAKNPGEVRIGVTGEKDSVKVSVTDPGPGIDKGQQQEIFNRFKSLDPSVHTLNKGHGLGLSIVKSYTELLGGKISLESGSSGSTFTIRMPGNTGESPSQEMQDSGEFLFDSGTQIF